MRLAVVASHPIQYYAPLFRELAKQFDLTVFFAHRATPADQAHAGFGVEFDWDVDLLSEYKHAFLRNVSCRPGLDTFAGCDTPDIAARFAEGRFDAVLVMGWQLKSFIQALIAAKRLSKPVLARGDSNLQTPRSALKKTVKAFIYPSFLRLFDAALYVGERSRAYWAHYGYPSERLFFSPHCVDVDWFASRATAAAREALRGRLGIARETKIALFAGKLVPFKRPLDLISAVAQLRAKGRGTEVLIAGSGPLEPQLVAATSATGVPCHMLGFCNQTDMPSAYAAADALVLPSTGRETWGLVANEALACGRCVVLSDLVGAAPDFTSGSAGRVFRMGDVAGLAQALDDVLLNPPTREAIAAQSARYGISTAIKGIVRAAEYATVLGSQARSSKTRS